MLEDDFKLVKVAMHISPELIPAIGALDRIKKELDELAQQTTNNARDVIAALEKELHQNYQPCHPFTRDDVLKWLRQHTPVA